MATRFRRKKSSGSWTVRYYDHTGRRRDKSTGTSDRRAAERIARDIEAREALYREGVVDPGADRVRQEAARPLREQVSEYLEHCRRRGLSAKHLEEKARYLGRLEAESGVTRLASLTPEALERHLRRMEDGGLAPSTVNTCRRITLAFMSWCKKWGRSGENSLTRVPLRDERGDRRLLRRSFTDEEMARLLAVAEPRGRKAWYMAAALAGLRRGDLQRLRWKDVDFEQSCLRISEGKAKRDDVLPLHPQLARELERHRPAGASSGDRVFPRTVTDRTRNLDFLRAGLARVEEYVGRDGKLRKRVVTRDEQGRVLDLHAMRTTLGTSLAREGVAPQVAQRILRHQDYRTTLKHYTALELEDTAQGLRRIRLPEAPRHGPPPSGVEGCPQICPPSERETAPPGATPCDEPEVDGEPAPCRKSSENQALNEPAQQVKSGGRGGTRTPNFHLVRVALWPLSYTPGWMHILAPAGKETRHFAPPQARARRQASAVPAAARAVAPIAPGPVSMGREGRNSLHRPPS